LFFSIKEVSWQGSNIVVFDTVTITPPYKLDNVQAHAECKALLHIRKVVSTWCWFSCIYYVCGGKPQFLLVTQW